jgi:hypothetical protein
MKIQSNTVRFLFATAAFGALTSFASAGPGAQYWTRARPVTTFTEAAATGAEDTVTMQCNKCKTVMVHNSRHVGPPAKGSTVWFAVGSKHTCDECKGEITVVKGKTEDSMQHNCSKCGEGAVTCCVAAAVES